MKFSEQWLRTWVNPDVSRDELIKRLSMIGLEVEAATPVAGVFSGTVVGQVQSVEAHPNADKLRLCQVSDGEQVLQIVCGAPNVRAGLKVPLARIGATLPGIVIKKAKLRGVESQGMLCSATELGLSEDHSGLLELPEDAPVGEDLRDYLQLDDLAIELSITPNRGDCLSIAGIAREVSALYDTPVQAPAAAEVASTDQQTLSIELKAPTACPRYLGRIIKGADLSQKTPLWMVERLRRSGIRSINVAVDVTNYVMLESGQPLHAFDLAEINGGICVRMAEEGETLRLLDGQEIRLDSQTLVIADHQRVLAMAGIMGGEHSGVSEGTRDIFLESAFFAPLAIAGKARQHGLHTDASHRFERGVDPALPYPALQRASELLIAICGGQAGPVCKAQNEPHLPPSVTIELREQRISQMLGTALPRTDIVRLLTALGLELSETGEGAWQVKVPSHRFDLSLEIDLIEELARLWGYDRLPSRFPSARLALRDHPEGQVEVSQLRQVLAARGYQEAITYSFIERTLAAQFAPDTAPLALANPISADMAVMRPSLWPGLIKALQYNLNRQQSRVRLFECGLRFIGSLDHLSQEPMLAGLISGSRLPEGWSNGRESVDFYDAKADVCALLAQGGAIDSFRFAPAEHPALHPGQTAQIEQAGKPIGLLGALHPVLAQSLHLSQAVFLFELQLGALQQGRLPAFAGLSRFPAVRRDLALIAPSEQSAGALQECIREQAGPYLTELCLFDLYQPKDNPKEKSLAFGLTWQHPTRTLTDSEINQSIAGILTALEQRFKTKLRT